MRRPLLYALFVTFALGMVFAQSAPGPTETAQSAAPAEVIPAHPVVPINQPEAQFPEEALKHHLTGVCLVALTVDATGVPQDLRVVRCSDPVFGLSSLDAAMNYRFKPATTAEGIPIATKITIEINYAIDKAKTPKMSVRCAITSPSRVSSLQPGTEGVYQFTGDVFPPVLTRFSDKGYGDMAWRIDGDGKCEVDLTIDAKGRPSDAQVVRCDKPILEKPAVESLLKSRYMPGNLNGKIVPIRVTVHLEFAGFAPAK